MTDELYINGSLVDTEDVEIVRTYKTPFFSDVTQLRNDGTLTIRLPRTARNTTIFEACFRTDFVSDLPYDFLYADYYFNGLPIFLHAEVRILNVDTYIEIQCVYGVDREALLPLFEKKLNEIEINPTKFIYEADWIVPWNKNDMFVSNKKFKYLDYISSQRTSDLVTVSGTIQEKLNPEEPALSNLKEMTWHPFVLSESIIYLGFNDAEFNSPYDFDYLWQRVDGDRLIGLILSGKKDKHEYVFEQTYTSWSTSAIEVSLTDQFNGDDTKVLIVGVVTDALHASGIKISDGVIDQDKIKAVFDLSLKLSASTQTRLIRYPNGNITQKETIKDTTITNLGSGVYLHELNFEVQIESGYTYSIAFDVETAFTYYSSGSIFTLTTKVENSIFAPLTDVYTDYDFGRYNCIANLPAISTMEFVQQLLIHTGLFIGYDSTGALKTFSLDTFKDYIDDADVIDWTGKVSNIRKSTFQFNSNAQKNYIKFANDKDLNADRKETIDVNDKTLPTERDMYVLEFDSPLGLVDEKSEMILYEQSVKRSGDTGVSFENKYVGDSWNNGFVINDAGVAKNIYAADPTYYTVHKKLVERPLVLECDVNLSIYESANIDFEKPIYCDEIGRYCLLLELQAPKYDVCVAKLLVVNQKL